jgi:SEC-C motif domain protein
VPRKPARAPLSDAAPCPCGGGVPYGDCCGPFLRGTAQAPTAELLMRSRYSAFAVGDRAYLLSSWHPATRPPELRLDPGLRWTGLEVLATDRGGAWHTEGTVAFVARYTADGLAGELRETSRFTRESGAWRYVGPAPGAAT